jgi:uncharacterized protein YkwD
MSMSMSALGSCSGHTAPPPEAADQRALVELLDQGDEPRLSPIKPAADTYQSQPAAQRQAAMFDDPLRASLQATVRNAGKANGVTVVPDSRLDAAMADLARGLRGEEQPSSAAVEFLLAHYGVVEPYPVFHVIRVARAQESSIPDEIGRRFTVPPPDRLVSVGVGIHRATSITTVVLAVQRKYLDLEPVPRQMTADATLTLRGRLLDRFTAPRLYITDPAGEAHEFAVQTGPDGFDVQIRCDRGTGAYQLEIFGDDSNGPRVLANFPVYCDTPPPTEFHGAVGYVAEPVAPADAEAMLLALINNARREASLPAIEADPELADVARAHSADMQQRDFVAHISPTTGGPMDRAVAAGLKPARLLENIGTGGSAEEVHAGLMRSPGHRKAILDPQVTRVGVGVVVAPMGGVIRLFATELFR